MEPNQTIYEGFHAPCWPPPPGASTPGFDRNPLSLQSRFTLCTCSKRAKLPQGNDPNYYPPINQLNACPSSIHQDRRTHEEVNVTVPFDQGQGAYTSQPPPRQALTNQGVHYPLPGTALMNYPATRMPPAYTVGAWSPFPEDSGNSNDRHAFNPAGRRGPNGVRNSPPL